MWIFSRDGFFSIVQNKYCRSDEIMVRSRLKKDLEFLSKKIKVGKILGPNKKEDYPYFAIVKKSSFAGYVSHETIGVVYENFRDAVSQVDQDEKREVAYMAAWGAIKNAMEEK